MLFSNQQHRGRMNLAPDRNPSARTSAKGDYASEDCFSPQQMPISWTPPGSIAQTEGFGLGRVSDKGGRLGGDDEEFRHRSPRLIVNKIR
ncbi:hypothetical protein FQN52_004469 [Onygenales sp. PD_12]|nr:hypothetical protein FQN52_004469 [Onygenales sp. PD_12]